MCPAKDEQPEVKAFEHNVDLVQKSTCGNSDFEGAVVVGEVTAPGEAQRGIAKPAANCAVGNASAEGEETVLGGAQRTSRLPALWPPEVRRPHWARRRGALRSLT